MFQYIQVFTTTGNREDAERMARTVVEQRLAGCAQILGPTRSVYWWKGTLEQSEEWLCIFKSRVDLYIELEAAIRKAHPYEVPEIVAVPVSSGSEEYLRWLDGELKGSP